MAKIGRNGLCLCGSGRKYKICCLNIESVLSPPFATEMFLTDIEVDKSKFDALELQGKMCVLDWINTSDSVQRIEIAFQMYVYSLSLLRSSCVSDSRGYMLRNNGNIRTQGFDLGIVINAHVIMLLDCFKLVVDKIKSFLTSGIYSEVRSKKEGLDTYRKLVSTVYENNFYYQLFYKLRNAVTHDRSIVSISEGKYIYFNLSQLRGIMRSNDELDTYIADIEKSIMENAEQTANFSFLPSLAYLHKGVLAVYSSFLQEIQPIVESLHVKSNTVLLSTTNLVFSNSGYFFVMIDETAHGFPITDDAHVEDWFSCMKNLISNEDNWLIEFMGSGFADAGMKKFSENVVVYKGR
ncbi:MAG: SEC-C domain-containing protein [Defluviitaleaceae bacterium]|nr:SEC-C domain-containing protein [Defluviitaleaceae bacterium]